MPNNSIENNLLTELIVSLQQALQTASSDWISPSAQLLDGFVTDIAQRLYESAALHFGGGHEEIQEYFEPVLTQKKVGAQLAKLFLSSEFATDNVCRCPTLLTTLLDSGALYRSYHINHANEYLFSIQSVAEGVSQESLGEAELMQLLRQFRQREMLRILFRDFNNIALLEETTRDLSLLAEACLDVALDFLQQALMVKHGTPIGLESGKAQRLVVMGMGKLGAYELNVSSDIDLIFAFPEAGSTDSEENSITNQEFFTKLGKALIRVIDTRTVDGFVFRVDMRLRPNGQSGPLVLSFSAMEDYYQQHGREWERYALIKSRCVAGDFLEGKQLSELLQPFVYRRYLDFGAIDALRDMKALIEQQVKRQNLSDDVKLGAGGIREIEFIVQSFQLIHGGRDRQFQQPHLLTMLEVLEKAECLPPEKISTLDGSYRLLRNTEHALQGWRDEQTQRLPSDNESLNRLAFTLNFVDADDFLVNLNQARDNVSDIFANVVTPVEWDSDEVGQRSNRRDANESSGVEDDVAFWQWLWSSDSYEGNSTIDQGLAERESMQLDDQFVSLVQQFNGSRRVASMEANSRDRLDRFMPLMLSMLNQQKDALLSLRQVLPFVESVLRRTAYLSLLIENPDALRRLVNLCSVSPWIAEQLARYPSLLDELLDYRNLFHVPDMGELRDELRQQLLRVQYDDQEGVMEVLRHFKLAHSLRVAACQINGDLPLMRISDYLTDLAEVILNAVVEDAWTAMVTKYGLPTKADGSASGGPFASNDFIVVGYGKLGGIELGPVSDLDLVFIHDVIPEHETMAEEGQRSILNAVFFTRLGQRIIHSLHTATVSGALYEVDMRLRPSGASGLLVSSFEAFTRYQNEQAWVWEHQALVRARAVAGEVGLQRKFEQFRTSLLLKHRQKLILRDEVVAMREKMRGHLTTDMIQTENDEFSLKQSRGGIVDIEFFVQYAVLAYAEKYPELTEWTDNIRLLDTLTKLKLVGEEQGSCLQNAYRVYREAAHLAALKQQNDTVSTAEFATHRKMVTAVWQETMIDG